MGHLVAAMAARYELRLDRVLLMVANQPWQKAASRSMAPVELRYEMVAASVEGHDGLEASRLEIDRGGLTYTVDTLQALKHTNSDDELYLILGTDAAAGLETWRAWEEIAALADIVVVNRPGEGAPRLGSHWRVHFVSMPALDISSTDLRARAGDGRPLDFLMPEAARVLLVANQLYSGDSP
jgi:nicotinate-nucleotide adenylyltransferase